MATITVVAAAATIITTIIIGNKLNILLMKYLNYKKPHLLMLFKNIKNIHKKIILNIGGVSVVTPPI